MSLGILTVDLGGLSRFELVALPHGQLAAPQVDTSTLSIDVVFPRRTVAEMTDPVILAARQNSIIIYMQCAGSTCS